MVLRPIKPIRRPREREYTPDIELMAKSQDEVSDREYFRLLEENSLYLFSRFSQEKIDKWREELRSTNTDTFGRAQENLKQIGASLGKIGSRKEGNYIGIVLAGDELEKEIREKGIDKAPLKERHQYLKEHYNIEANNSIKTAGQMASIVVSKVYNLPIATVTDYRKKRKRIISEHERDHYDILKKQEEIFHKNEQFREEHPEIYTSMLIRMGILLPDK